MHLTASTSRDHFRTYDAGGLYKLIKAKMAEDPSVTWCIADLAVALNIERSTISPRLGELRDEGAIAVYEKKPSRSTGITAQHWQLTRDTLFNI